MPLASRPMQISQSEGFGSMAAEFEMPQSAHSHSASQIHLKDSAIKYTSVISVKAKTHSNLFAQTSIFQCKSAEMLLPQLDSKSYTVKVI